jgi:hypothetical protein
MIRPEMLRSPQESPLRGLHDKLCLDTLTIDRRRKYADDVRIRGETVDDGLIEEISD